MPPPRPDAPQETKRVSGPSAPPPLPHADPTSAVETGDNEDDDDVGPKPPAPVVGAKRKAGGEAGEDGEGEGDVNGDEDEDEDEDEGFEDGDDAEQLPISHEIVLKDHTKVSRLVLLSTRAYGRSAQRSLWTLLERVSRRGATTTIRSCGTLEGWTRG